MKNLDIINIGAYVIRLKNNLDIINIGFKLSLKIHSRLKNVSLREQEKWMREQGPQSYPKPKEIIYRKAMSLPLNIHYNMHKLIIQSTKEKCER
jgi:hypothetical protein